MFIVRMKMTSKDSAFRFSFVSFKNVFSKIWQLNSGCGLSAGVYGKWEWIMIIMLYCDSSERGHVKLCWQLTCVPSILYIYIYMFCHAATSLWLVADFASVASYITSVFGNIKPSQPRFCQKTAQHRNSVPYSFQTVRGVFYIPQDYEQ